MKARIESDSDMTLDGKPYPAEQNPVMLMVIDYVFEEIDTESGNFKSVQTISTYEVEDDDDVPAEKLAQWRTVSRQMEGAIIESRLNARGELIHADVIPPEGSPPKMMPAFESMKSSAGQHFVPMPVEAVGIGATWETRVGPIGPTGIMQTSIYTLLERDGDIVVIDIALSQTAEPKQLSRSKLVEFTGFGKGTMTLDLRTMATDATIESTSESKFNIGDDEAPSMLAQRTETIVHIETEIIDKQATRDAQPAPGAKD